MNINDIENNIDTAVNMLKAISNEKRLRIVYALYNGEKSVGELEDIVELSQSALSQHLARLRRDKLVKARRQAQTIFYSMDSHAMEETLKCIHMLYADSNITKSHA